MLRRRRALRVRVAELHAGGRAAAPPDGPRRPVPGGVSVVSLDADDPLLLVQVTEFSCGGFVVADGTGMAQFLQAVGELARGTG